MEELLVERLDLAGGPAGRLGVWARAVLDLAAVAAGEGWRTTMGRITGGRRGGGMDRWMQDLAHAARTLMRTPTLTLMVVGTLALGVGASTATFSVVNAVVLKPLPYAEPDRLVSVWPEQNFNASMVRELQETAPALEWVTGISGWTLTLTGEGEPLQIDGARVSPRHFRTLGVRPALGRDFTDEDGVPGNEAVAILSHGLWVRAFGADPDVVGRTVDLATNDHPRRTIVGVMPPDFRPVRGRPEVWIPWALDTGTTVEQDETWYVNDRVARLAPGATLEQADEQVRAFARDMGARIDQTISAERVEVAGVRPLLVQTAGELGPVLWVALGAVSLVLLIACANVTNLLLARGEARRADLAVRAALGAGRGRVARLLLMETGLAGLVGGLAGVALSFGLVRAVVTLAPADFPRVDEIAVDGLVLAFALAATSAAALGAGLIPALWASRVDATAALGGATRGTTGRRSSGLTRVLAGLEVALALVVVVGSGLMIRSLHRMTSQDPGLQGRGVLVLQPTPPEGRYPSGQAFHAYYEQVLERVKAVPTVAQASAIHLLPGTMNNWSFPTFPEGVPVSADEVIPSVNFRVVWPDYFETSGMTVLRGRPLTAEDGADATPAAVVNEAFVRRFWPGDEALGRELRVMSTEARAHLVVGVVADVRQHGLGREPRPEMYFTHAQVTWNMSFWVMARMLPGVDPLTQAAAVREAVWSVDPDVPISGMDELATVVDRSAATTRFLATVLGTFGGLALLLAAVGVFGVTAYGVGRRSAEFGLRIALGASRGEVLRAAVRGSFAAVVVGLLVGLAAASLASGTLSSALYEVEPSDPVTFAAVASLLLGVAVVAALVPAWRASRVDPVTVLNRE